MPYTYTQLGGSDLQLFRELIKVFGEAFGESETYENNAPSDAYLEKLFASDYFIALAAQDENGEVVGGLTAYELKKFEQERSEIYIYDLAVAEPHRRKGIATALINTLKVIAKERGAYVIFVQADLVDEPAIKLYESLGKREEVLHFDIPIK